MAEKPKSEGNPNIVKLWPTTLLVRRFAHYQKVIPAILNLFYRHRNRNQRGSQQLMPFPYAGDEDRVIVSFHAQVYNAGGSQSYD